MAAICLGREAAGGGILLAPAVRQRWDEHVSGRRGWQYDLWNILMFEAWLEASRKPAMSEPSLEPTALPG